tara:strand:- start:246 stop:404 length:159 start_codon:yes stop_codon:yes gene_type:complete
MHHDVMKQIRIGVAAHKAYVDWMHTGNSLSYDNYIMLKDLMEDYVPDPNARF